MRGLFKVFSGFRQMVGGVTHFIRTLPEDLLFWAEGRDWQIDFGPIEGKKGETKTVEIHPQCRFRGEKMMATDSYEDGQTKHHGYGTRVQQIIVGSRLQMPAGNHGTLTVFFANSTIGNGLRWDTCKMGQTIYLTVHFLQDCRFDMTCFGRAVH